MSTKTHRKRSKKKRGGKFTKLHGLDTEVHKTEVSFVLRVIPQHAASLRLTIRPKYRAGTRHLSPSHMRTVIRLSLTVAETDYAVADLAEALDYEIVTVPRRLQNPRLSFWGAVLDGDTTIIYMTASILSAPKAGQCVRVVVPLSKRRAQTLLNKIADPLGWDLFNK